VTKPVKRGTGTSGALAPPEPDRRLMVTSADGIRLAAEVHGSAHRPTVVLSHGWTCSARLWAPVIRELRGDMRVIAYDQRGHGGSDRPLPFGYRADALADDLAAVLDQTVPAGGRAVLAGHSMGGMAIMAAASRPDLLARASGVLLASTACCELVAGSRVVPFARHVPALRAVMRSAAASELPLGPASLVSRAVLAYVTLGQQASAQVRAANADIIHACNRRARAAWGRVLATLDLTAGARLLDLPVRILVGAADRLTPPVQARRLDELLPCSEGITELAGVGHMTPLEAPQMVAHLIRALAAGSGGQA
jgi:pimeloyl-ACP methyl ester carboxylesterase